MLYDDIRGYLLGQSGITDVVGQRVYALAAPGSAAKPHIIFGQTRKESDHVMGGAAGVAHPVFRFDCVATSVATVLTVAEALRQELHGFSGSMGAMKVWSVELDDEADQAIRHPEGSDTYIYIRSVSYMLEITETVPTF